MSSFVRRKTTVGGPVTSVSLRGEGHQVSEEQQKILNGTMNTTIRNCWQKWKPWNTYSLSLSLSLSLSPLDPPPLSLYLSFLLPRSFFISPTIFRNWHAVSRIGKNCFCKAFAGTSLLWQQSLGIFQQYQIPFLSVLCLSVVVRRHKARWDPLFNLPGPVQHITSKLPRLSSQWHHVPTVSWSQENAQRIPNLHSACANGMQ